MQIIKNKKQAAGIGVAALAVAALALGTGTYAAFQDTETGPGGTLAAGTLELNVTTDPAGAVPLFKAEKIAPGYKSPKPMTVTVANSGTIDGVLTADLVATPNTGGGLQKYLTVEGSCTSPAGTQTFGATPITAIPQVIKNVPLKGGEKVSCNFTFAFPDNGGDQNDAQGDKVDFSSKFTLKQA